MSKRGERYSRRYKIWDEPGERDDYPDKEDTIINALEPMYLRTSWGGDRDLGGAQFLAFENNSLAKICIGITRSGKGRYVRYVSLVIMPSSAQLPKELSDLLKEKGFKKSD